MRVTIERSELLRSLNHVQSVVERRNTIPILSNVLLQADGAAVKLSATDLDLEIVESAPAEVAQAGSTTASAHILYDIVRKLPDGSQLELEQGPDDHRLLVRCGRSQFTLQALPAEEFPDLSGGDLDRSFSLAASVIKRMIEKTRFAISTEETRYYLNGIYLHEVELDGESRLRAVATDGHRLAQVQVALPDGAAGMPGVIVPRKTVLELHKLIDGTYPDYERVIPKENDKTMEVDARQFAQAVDRVSTVSSEKGRAVKLNLEGDKLVLSVNNPDSGSAVEELTATYDGDALDIGFNARYLLDITGQLNGDVARFLLADAGSPTIVRDVEDETALYVLMPMRV